MSRHTIEDIEPVAEMGNSMDKLHSLIPQYAYNKGALDQYKQLCDTDNAEIKKIMTELDITECEAEGYIAKKSIQHKESMNEDKLLMVIKKYNIPNVIATKEYVDMDALEKYLYNNDVDGAVLTAMGECKTSTEVVQLRVSKVKERKVKE